MNPAAEVIENGEQSANASAKALPSGRSVVLRYGSGQEEIEVRSPAGDVEIRIVLTADGPVVRLGAARIELESAEDVAIRCRRFTVATSETTELHSQGDVRIAADGEIRARSQADMRLDGKMIYLNS
jgi:hypothetical protein